LKKDYPGFEQNAIQGTAVCGMDRGEGDREACQFVKDVDFNPSEISFDSAFEE